MSFRLLVRRALTALAIAATCSGMLCCPPFAAQLSPDRPHDADRDCWQMECAMKVGETLRVETHVIDCDVSLLWSYEQISIDPKGIVAVEAEGSNREAFLLRALHPGTTELRVLYEDGNGLEDQLVVHTLTVEAADTDIAAAPTASRE